MRIKIKKNLIYYFWILKVIFDMFYQIKFLTIFITIFAVILLLHAILKKNLKICYIDWLIIILMLLFTISFIKSPNFYLDYLKIISSFVLYFLGRFYFNEYKECLSGLKFSLLVALIVNFIVCVCGKGTIIWGNAITYRGLYYFKTDFAIELLFFIIFWLYNSRINLKNIIPCLIAIFLIILCNARIVYLCTLISLFFLYLYKSKNKHNLISLKNLCVILFIGISSLYLLKFLSKTNLFLNNNLISLDFNSISDLFNGSNTQGRNEIWKLLFNNFNSQNLITKIFGAGLDFNSIYGYYGLNEHNLFIKILINTGYFGIFVFFIFIISVLLLIKKEGNKKLCYITFTVFLIYLIVGISVPTILFTNYSWIPMFLIGCCISYEKNKKLERGSLNE